MWADRSQDTQSASWRPRRADGIVLVQGQETNVLAQQSGRQTFSLSFLFYSSLHLMGWNPPHYQGQSALLSLLIHMLISFRDSLVDTPIIIFWPNIWESYDPVNLTHNNHHRDWKNMSFLLSKLLLRDKRHRVEVGWGFIREIWVTTSQIILRQRTLKGNKHFFFFLNSKDSRPQS